MGLRGVALCLATGFAAGLALGVWLGWRTLADEIVLGGLYAAVGTGVGAVAVQILDRKSEPG